MNSTELSRAIDAIKTLAFQRESTRQYILNVLQKRIRKNTRQNGDMKFKSLFSSVPRLKKELDRVFSIFIRTRGMDENGYNACVTCGLRLHWKSLDCGHYQPRQDLNTRWDEKNCYPQSKNCNGFRGGMPEAMAKHIDKTHGPGASELLQAKSKIQMKLDRSKLSLMIRYYKQKIGEI